MRYRDSLHISIFTNDTWSTVFNKTNHPYPPTVLNMGQWSWEGPTMCPWARHLLNLKDLNGPSPLAIFRKHPSLLLTFFLLVWTSRWSCVCFCCCLNSCVHFWWKHRCNEVRNRRAVCVSDCDWRLWRRFPATCWLPSPMRLWPIFQLLKAPQNSWQGLFCEFTFVFLLKLIPNLFHFRFWTLRALFILVSTLFYLKVSFTRVSLTAIFSVNYITNGYRL